MATVSPETSEAAFDQAHGTPAPATPMAGSATTAAPGIRPIPAMSVPNPDHKDRPTANLNQNMFRKGKGGRGSDGGGGGGEAGSGPGAGGAGEAAAEGGAEAGGESLLGLAALL